MMTFNFLDDYRLDFSIRSLLGSRSRLQDVPKIAQLIEASLHRWFDERCVEPRFQEIALPSMWPRKKNTRGPEDGLGEGSGGSVGRAKGRDMAQGFQADAQTDAGAREDRAHGTLRRRRLGNEEELVMPGSLPEFDLGQGGRYNA